MPVCHTGDYQVDEEVVVSDDDDEGGVCYR